MVEFGWLVAFFVGVLILWLFVFLRDRDHAHAAQETEAWDEPTYSPEPLAAPRQVKLDDLVTVSLSTEIREVEYRPEPLPPFGSIRGAAYQIEYMNSEGTVTERVIRLRDVRNDEGRVYVIAHCLLSREERTFRADRMLKLYDHRTGEQIENAARHFAQFGEDEPQSDEHALVMGRARPGLKALIWIARADREISADEMSILLDYIEARRNLPGARAGELVWDRDFARRWIDAERPTYDNAMGALGRMRRGGNEARLFLEFANRLARSTAAEKRREKLLRVLV